MQDLRVIGVENGALLVASDDGTKYRIAIDEVCEVETAPDDPIRDRGKLAPREIQAHPIRCRHRMSQPSRVSR
jgi:hypothetical protein